MLTVGVGGNDASKLEAGVGAEMAGMKLYRDGFEEYYSSREGVAVVMVRGGVLWCDVDQRRSKEKKNSA